LGELGACWGLADIAFVGGSLTQRGGQNMIEPAAYGAAVLFGPNTWNFRDVVERLLSADAARVVVSRDDLTETIRKLLTDPTAAARQGRIAQQLVLAQQGATKRTCELIVNAIAQDTKPHVRAA
jgi:3-deoxy-D-manno-octulosonic-acid transferase